MGRTSQEWQKDSSKPKYIGKCNKCKYKKYFNYKTQIIRLEKTMVLTKHILREEAV